MQTVKKSTIYTNIENKLMNKLSLGNYASIGLPDRQARTIINFILTKSISNGNVVRVRHSIS